MAIQVAKNLFGRHSVKYDCPQCKSRLTSPLDDAGKQDSCPDCGVSFLVPGVTERREVLAQQERSRAEKQRRTEMAAKAKAVLEQQKAAQQAKLEELRTRHAEHNRALEQQRFSAGATKRCPICAEFIHVNAKKCKYCEELLPVNPQSSKKNEKNLTKALFVLIGLFFVGALIPTTPIESHRTTVSSSDESLIIDAAQSGVRSILKSPSTASFPSRTFNRDAYVITVHSSDSCTVSGYVDAQNSFGATLRNYWKVDCERNGRFWHARNAVLLGP